MATLIIVIVKILFNACNKPCHMSALESFLLASIREKNVPDEFDKHVPIRSIGIFLHKLQTVSTCNIRTKR